MPAPDFAMRLVSEVQLEGSHHRWQVFVRYGARRYQLGTWLLYADAHRACSASAIEKALGSTDKCAKREVAEGSTLS
jgi:hypothetical protein